MSHFDEITCLLYLDGQLDPGRADELVAHADSCADCRALLDALERESRLLREALTEEEEAVPARLLWPPAREVVSWVRVASLGLAAGGAYTLWTGIVEPWYQQLSQAGFGQGGVLTLLFFGGAFWKGWGAMTNTLQFLAVVTLGILAVAVLRRTWRRWTTVTMVMGALMAVLGLPPAAEAAEVKKHMESYTLSPGEVLKNDLFLFARTAHIDGTVEGDLVVFCQSLTVDGRVTGDVIAFAREVRINGQVDGNVRSFNQSLFLGGSVERNVITFVETLEFDTKAQVGGSLTLFAAHATLDGRLGRDLMGSFGEGELNGFIGGNALLRAGHQFIIGPKAEIQGKASFRGPYQPRVSPEAKLASPVTVEIVRHRPDYTSPRFYWRQVLRFGAAFLFGLMMVLLLPRFFGDVVSSSRRYGPALGLGFLMLIATPILAVIACLLLVGLSVGLSTLLLYALAVYAAQVFVGTWLGQELLGESSETGAVLGRLALGLLVLRVVGNVPYLGPLAWLVVIVWGLGALSLTCYARLQRQPAAA